MSDVPAGKMRLFTLIRPVWRPGTHFLWLQQAVTEPGDPKPLVETTTGIQTEFVFRVTGPRTTLPPEEVLGCYPAPGSPEASDTCIPHVVLRRRTLPWERALTSDAADPALQPPADTPWLALLLFPADAAAIESAPLSAVYPSGTLTALGLDGTAVCDQVVAPRYWLRWVMPRREDLKLLTHARQLSLADREARDDDDGFMALVMTNRLPQSGKAHLACLVSLEGKWDEDIWPGTEQLKPVSAIADGGGTQAESAMSAVAVDDGGGADYGGGNQGPGQDPGPGLPLPELLPVRLVVLHSWTFTAGDGGDFEATMQKIGAAGVQRFAASPPEMAGFVPLERADREGDVGTALYRGPIVPVALARDPEIATSADGALEREDGGDAADAPTVVSHAAAFELGRLLTLSSDGALAALQAWRGDSQALRAGRFLLEDRFEPLAAKVLPFLPPNAEEIWRTMWQGAPALDAAQLQTFAGDPTGIAHLMETVPGLTWSTLSQVKPEMLAVDFTSARSIAAHASLGLGPGPAIPAELPGIDLSSIPLADPGLGATLDVGFPDLMNLASDAVAP